MSMFTVSVVIPVRNRAALVVEALDAVKAQSLAPLEVLVVDDGSTDGTPAAVEAWASRNPRVPVRLTRQASAGANAARNRGIRESRGELLAFLDSDDRWLPGKLAKQVQMLSNDGIADGIYCGARIRSLDSGELVPAAPRAYPTGQILAALLVRDVTAPTSCWMVRRACLDEVGLFDETLPARQDWDLWIRLAARYTIAAVPEVLVELGEHTGERVRTDEDREIAAHRAIFEKYAELRRPLGMHVSLQARSAMYRRRGRVYLHRKGRRLAALGLQIGAMATWPFSFDGWAALGGTLLPASVRRRLRGAWNGVFGATRLGIRSH